MGREADRKRRRAQGVPERSCYTPEERKAVRASRAIAKWRANPAIQERNKEMQRLRRERDPEAFYAKTRVTDRKRYIRHREKRISESIQVRAKRAGATGSHTIAEWKSVLRHFGRKCVYCNTKLTPKNVSRDHRQPLCRSGSNDIRNIVPACRSCNSKKHDKTFEEFRKVLQ
jgi:5-methylcytosine-specific restriction endonuclease McrA